MDLQYITLKGHGLTAKILPHGAALQDLRLDGHKPSLVLGFPKAGSYQPNPSCFGAIVGPVANRIRGAKVEIDGQTFALDPNWIGAHTLHGGSGGTSECPWTVGQVTDTSAELHLQLPDGQLGFPGNLDIKCTYELLATAKLKITLEATSDRTTMCNLAPHIYFNLDGRPTLDEHRLSVASDTYVATDVDLLPTGELPSVEGKAFDYRTPASLLNHSLDLNFCLSDKVEAVREVANLTSRASGRTMVLKTNQPGLQVYNGAEMQISETGLDGAAYGPFAGLALEPQNWPDAPNHAHFPECLLHPGETYRNETVFEFS